MAWCYDDERGIWWDDEPTFTELRTEFGYPVTPPPVEDLPLPSTQPMPPVRDLDPPSKTDGWTYAGPTVDGGEVWVAPVGTPAAVALNAMGVSGHPELSADAPSDTGRST